MVPAKKKIKYKTKKHPKLNENIYLSVFATQGWLWKISILYLLQGEQRMRTREASLQFYQERFRLDIMMISSNRLSITEAGCPGKWLNYLEIF